MPSTSEDELKVDKISRVIWSNSTRNFLFSIHIKLLKEKEGRSENFHQLFSFADKKYLKLDLQSFFTLEIKDKVWDKSKSIMIDQRNITQITKGLEESVDRILNGNIFALDKSHRTICFAEEARQNIVTIQTIGSNQFIQIVPALIYDENDITYEGVVFYLNNSNNYVELPFEIFESLVHTIKESNLFVYSQLLLNYYISALENEKVALKEVKVEAKESKKKTHALFAHTEKEEVVEATTNNVSDDQFFGKKN